MGDACVNALCWWCCECPRNGTKQISTGTCHTFLVIIQCNHPSRRAKELANSTQHNTTQHLQAVTTMSAPPSRRGKRRHHHGADDAGDADDADKDELDSTRFASRRRLDEQGRHAPQAPTVRQQAASSGAAGGDAGVSQGSQRAMKARDDTGIVDDKELDKHHGGSFKVYRAHKVRRLANQFLAEHEYVHGCHCCRTNCAP